MDELKVDEEKGMEVIDGNGYLITPGFINSHTHVAMTVLRGFADDMPLWEWLTEKIWPLEEKLNSEDIYWSSLLGMIEMVRTGTTTFNDMYMFRMKQPKLLKNRHESLLI